MDVTLVERNIFVVELGRVHDVVQAAPTVDEAVIITAVEPASTDQGFSQELDFFVANDWPGVPGGTFEGNQK
eukprot:7380259-Prymnesium_polylepis.1